MIINRFIEVKRFFNLHKIEEHIFHLACNNFNHIHLKKMELINLQENSKKDFFILIRGKLKGYYEKENLENYENYFTKKRKKNKIENEINNSNQTWERILTLGEYFTESIKYQGYIIKRIESIEDADLVYLDEQTFSKIFSSYLIKFEKNKRNFLLRTIPVLSEISRKKFETFLKQIDTMVIIKIFKLSN